jgi:hypothetical protein
MLQVFRLGVANIDLDVAYIFMCFKCFHTYVASVFHLDVAMFVMDKHVFLSFFWCFVSVLDVCCKCFNYFQTYVASVLSECCKSRSDIAHVKWDPLDAAVCCSC